MSEKGRIGLRRNARQEQLRKLATRIRKENTQIEQHLQQWVSAGTLALVVSFLLNTSQLHLVLH